MDKPKCATCLWYAPERPGATHGLCMYAPPVIQVVVPPATPIGGQPRPIVQGLRPPTAEGDRCAKHSEHNRMPWETGDARLPLLP